MNKQPIKAILFDLGGVMLDLFPHRTFDAFSQLAGRTIEASAIWAKESCFNDFETGKISEEVFFNELRLALGKPSLPLADLEKAWNAMLGDFPLERFEWIKEASTHSDLYVLSNTNSAHVKHFENTIEQKFGLKTFKQLFKKIYYSHELGERKPDIAIFEKILNEGLIKAEETLFIEDTAINTVQAREVGFQTLVIKQNQLRREDIIYES